MPTIKESLAWGAAKLEIEDAQQVGFEVSFLLCHVLEVERSYLITWPEKEISEKQFSQYQQLISLRSTGKPVAYILGQQEFWSMSFKVTEHTLIPRADTEVLVEAVLAQLPSTAQQILELGTGTGAIACALASERKLWSIIATDMSEGALAVAQYNIQKLGFKNIQLLASNWFKNVSPQQFDAIVSNPPYVESNSVHLSEGTRFEPQSALISGQDGLDDIRIIIAQAKTYLKPSGFLFLEHGFEQAEAVAELFLQDGYENIQNIKDYAGCTRVSFASRL
tara:strand:+ start:11459 stop:12295 length:837 start_codon:yes stop_codon:yes gene_type:complete